MPLTGGPQLRVHATFVVTLYACILLGGALLQHPDSCNNTPAPHCTLCASVNAIPLVVEIAAPSPEFVDAGEVAPIVTRGARVVASHGTASRAPPAAETNGDSPRF